MKKSVAKIGHDHTNREARNPNLAELPKKAADAPSDKTSKEFESSSNEKREFSHQNETL